LDVKGKTQEQINDIVHKEIDRLIEVEADSSPILEAWLKEGSVQIKRINQKDLPVYVDRSLIPMYGAKRGYSFTGDNVKFDTGQGECVYDFLMATYGKEKRLKHDITCRADLLKIMDRKSYSQGVRAIDLRKFCIFIKVPMYGIDLNQKVFIKLTAEDLREMNITPQRALPPLIFMLANAHMYPITDKSFRKCVAEWAKEYTLSVSSTIASDNRVQKVKNSIYTKAIEVDPPLEDVMSKKDKLIIITKSDCLGEVFNHIVFKHNLFPEVNYQGNSITQLFIKNLNLNILCNIHYHDIIKICDTLKIPFHNQGIGTITNLLIDKHLATSTLFGGLDLGFGKFYHHIHSITSELNEKTYKIWLNLHKKPFTHVLKASNPFKTAVAVDVRRCYQTMYQTTKYDFCMYSVKDEPHVFNGKITETGFYYVVTSQFFPFRGNDWYCREMVEFGLEHNLISLSDIRYELIPSSYIPDDFFQPIIANMKKSFAFPTHDKSSTVDKLLINAMNGCMNKMQSMVYKPIFTSSIDEASFYYMMASDKDKNQITYHADGEGAVFYEIRQASELHWIRESRRPIYAQIIDLSNIQLYKLSEHMKAKGGDVVALKVDCVQAEFDSETACTSVHEHYYQFALFFGYIVYSHAITHERSWTALQGPKELPPHAA
jgi:hypothetical protein